MGDRRLALVVAVDRYDDTTLRGLAAPAADAVALADVLGSPELGGFEVDVVSNATSWVIAEHVDALLAERRTSDLVLLHFSCHGLKDESGELYLAATNTRTDRLATTAVDAALVNRLMRRSRAQRVVLLLDCCYGGAFERGVVARSGEQMHVGEQFAPASLGGGRGRVVITASSAMEYAFESGELTIGGRQAPSLFTGALVDGIRSGAADRDQDGRVSLDELYDHVFDTVQARTPNQTPSRWEFGVQGELVIARNPNLVAARSLPSGLTSRVLHPDPDVRVGTVTELSGLARADDLQLATAAATALASLQDDHSRRVCQAARATLRALAPRPERTVVDLGRIAARRPLAAQVVVEGNPLALASSAEAPDPDVEVQFEDGLLTLSVNPTRPGHLDTSVVLHSAFGDTHVDVVADVVERVGGRGRRNDIVQPQVRRTRAVLLVLLGAAAFTVVPLMRERSLLPLLPAVACLLSLACLTRRTLLPFATGLIVGAAAWALTLWSRTTVARLPSLEQPADKAPFYVEATRLVAGLSLTLAAVLLIVSFPPLRARLHLQRDHRAAFAVFPLVAALLLVVLPGFMEQGWTYLPFAARWTLIIVVCLPVTVLRLDAEQRSAALTAVTALWLFTVARNVYRVLDGEHGWEAVGTVVGAILALVGCYVAQAQPHRFLHGHAPRPNT